MTQPAKSLEFDTAAFEDLAWWIEKDRKKALRIIKLIREIQRDPFVGTGKAEPLKHELADAGPEESIPNTVLFMK